MIAARPVRGVLAKHVVESSAPCRVDCGGTWDLKAFAVPYHSVAPCTVNIAVNVRTRVRLMPFANEWVKVSSEGFADEEYPIRDAPFNSPLGLIFGIISTFGYSGIHVDIVSESPPKSGLGGSGTVSVAVIAALSKLGELVGDKALDREQIVKLAYLIEDGLAVSLTGMQDQMAAGFGGVNRWDWKTLPGSIDFHREELVPRDDAEAFNERFLVAYCGQSHESSKVNELWVNAFLNGSLRELWTEINSITREFSRQLKAHQWSQAAGLLSRENDLRRVIAPACVVPVSAKLIKQAEDIGCGARITGAGGGGCVWGLGERERIARLRTRWQELIQDNPQARLLDCRVDFEGIRISVSELP